MLTYLFLYLFLLILFYCYVFPVLSNLLIKFPQLIYVDLLLITGFSLVNISCSSIITINIYAVTETFPQIFSNVYTLFSPSPSLALSALSLLYTHVFNRTDKMNEHFSNSLYLFFSTCIWSLKIFWWFMRRKYLMS